MTTIKDDRFLTKNKDGKMKALVEQSRIMGRTASSCGSNLEANSVEFWVESLKVLICLAARDSYFKLWRLSFSSR